MNPPPTTSAPAQPYLGSKGLIAFLGALSAFPALSTDLYLPALPTMTAYFGVPAYQTNLTLTVFFIFYAISLIVSGPLSDRYGRKPVILAGLAVFLVSGLLCGISVNVFELMAFRIFQALGAGAGSTVATAIVKDAYKGRKREVTLAVVQSITVLAPLLAPMIGALVLRVTSWRGVFLIQGVCALLVLAAALAYRETAPYKLTGNPFASLKRLGTVMSNRTFAYLLGNFSLLGMIGLVFVSSSSYIYEDVFGVSSGVYSLFYALFGVGIAIGPSGYLWLSRRLPRNGILTGCWIASLVSGLLVFLVGARGPWPFIIAYFPTAVSISCVRPASTYLMLEQHDSDAGSASGLIVASNMIMGSIATVIAALDVWGRVQLTGTIIWGAALLGLLMWLGLSQPRVRAQARAANAKAAEARVAEAQAVEAQAPVRLDP